MASHFVEGYERLVAAMVAMVPLDEATSRRVGGQYDGIGRIECDIVRHAGLRGGVFPIDIGSGSGRLSSVPSAADLEIDYLGTDVVQKLLDYLQWRHSIQYGF
jgi:hypothetical protein